MKYKFEFDAQQIEIISRALGAQPYSIVAALVVEMQNQINAQNTQQAPKEEAQ